MFRDLANILVKFAFVGILAPAQASASELHLADLKEMVADAKKELGKHKIFNNLSRYTLLNTPLRPTDMRPMQAEALLVTLELLREKDVFCTAEILEVGFGSPSLMAALQKMRQQYCPQVKRIVGIDPNNHDDWVEPFDQILSIDLIKTDLESFSTQQHFDVVIAVDVFKGEEDCAWNPYKHSTKNSDALRSITSASAVIIVVNDFSVASILDDDLRDTFSSNSYGRMVDTEAKLKIVREYYKLDSLYGHLWVTVYSRNGNMSF